MSQKIKGKLTENEKKLELISLAEIAISEILNDIDLVTTTKSKKSYSQTFTTNSKDRNQSMEDQLRESRERIMRLKDLSLKLRNGNMQEMENIPAYKRKELAISSKENSSILSSNTQGEARAFSTLSSGFDAIKLSRQGLAKQELTSFAKKMSLTVQELANVMHISERTLQRYDDNEIVRPEYAEKAIELARLYNRGEEVFDSMDKFKLWMKSPSFVFNGESPISLLDTSAGFDMVFKELGRIEYGIFA